LADLGRTGPRLQRQITAADRVKKPETIEAALGSRHRKQV
jgi:hypothetical protein